MILLYLNSKKNKIYLVSYKNMKNSMNKKFNFTASILSNLQYFNSLDIVYRDLKPENILLKEDGSSVFV